MMDLGPRTEDPERRCEDRKSQCPYEADMWAYEDTVIAIDSWVPP